ncbi:MAG: tetratricopeptide repeat protein [Chitinophagaceae bacterium]|nr:tetratricopeptide repeat protein [Chitinophagaceae bacterium]
MLRIIFLLCWSLVLPNLGWTQDINIDSLLRELSKTKDDTNKVKNLSAMCIQLINTSEFNKAKRIADEGLKLSKKIDFRKGEGQYDNFIGIIFYRQGNYPEALNYFFSSLKIREEIQDKRGIASAYQNIGNVYKDQGNYNDALSNYFTSLKMYESIGDDQGSGLMHNNLGNVYALQNSDSNALKEYFIALNIFEKIDDKMGMAGTHNNLAMIYQKQGKNTDGLKEFLTALKISEEIGDKDGMAMTYNNIGSLKTDMNYVAEAKECLMKGLHLGMEIGSKERIRDSYFGLAQADSALGNFKDAFEHKTNFFKYRDSLYNEENTKKTVEAIMQYQFDKKEAVDKAVRDKQALIQRYIRNTIAVGLIGSLLFLIVVFRQRNKVKMEKEKVEIEKERNEELLQNILPDEVITELKQHGGSVARQYNNVTVLFTDFVNFTGISETLSPTELVAEIHKSFSAFDDIIQRNGLEKIKTIGDAYLAVCGLPNESSDHAKRVVKAALEICNYVKESNSKFQIRIGVNSGPVVAGIVGVKKYAYDIWGDTVNTANRMETHSEPNKINISISTYELVKDTYPCTPRGKVSVKGKNSLDMFFVES